jgi:hypothetical protein
MYRYSAERKKRGGWQSSDSYTSLPVAWTLTISEEIFEFVF